ncbi:pirin family protein [Idiomarina xiamenensis]|uniref:Pirin n=1 Tax=Idiomarina xiamenensis 10-D-4 TaxID=740709 RepID=K2KQV2_9GAMM|nr:pirin family protein [Idiomarina xiamenensis]EKE84834.1 pirin [Idiomarina xiamenensis 10-D-4]
MSAILQRARGIPAQDGAGVKLTRIINQPNLRYQDPFLMLDEFRSDDPNDYIAGFPAHPHRGFSTLTYMLAGQMGHQDSVGNEGVVGAGGAQWMKAARGIIHSEMPKQEDGLMWGFQLWINLPAKDKLSDPDWADHPAESIPERQQHGHTIRLIAGEYEGMQGPVQQPEQAILVMDVQLQAGSELELPALGQATRLAYIYQGELTIDGEPVKRGELVRLSAERDLQLSADNDAALFYLAGKPIAEPIAQYGPFVMNSSAEVEQAIRDYQAGNLAANEKR